MNQYLTSNHYRRFPFVQDAILPFTDQVVVDAQMVLAESFALFDGGSVQLIQLDRGVGLTTLTWSIVSTALPGYLLVGDAPDSADDTRILLTLQDGSSIPHPELGYGYLVIGDAQSLTTLSGTTVMSADLEVQAVRTIDTNPALQIFVANKTRLGPSVCNETEGTPQVLTLQNRATLTIDDCIEVTTVPTALQAHVAPDGTVTMIAIPSPGGTHDETINTTVTTITTHAVAIQDILPVLPSGYDALVDGGVACAGGCVVSEGHNVDLAGSVPNKTVEFHYRLGGGSGIDCLGVLGYPDLGVLAVDAVKSINGVHTTAGDFTLKASTGISLVAGPAEHKILILVNGQDLTRAAP